MKRRTFITGFGAAFAAPALPIPSFALPGNAAAAISGSTYKWAEIIVRAHKTCTTAMLQRNLKIDAAAAKLLKSELVRNGVISAQANVYGIHSAFKPLYEGAFVNPMPKPAKALDAIQKAVENSTETTEFTPEYDIKDSDLEQEPNVELDTVESKDEEAKLEEETQDFQSPSSALKPL